MLRRCRAVGDWEQAKDLFEKMRLRGCKPDGGSFAALITALQAGGQWQHTLQTLDRMQACLLRKSN
jgi:pentatricopeptide repeat protein